MPVWKPVGPSSYDLIRIFKRAAGFRGAVGHGGTLDPFASGVVLLLLGDATKRFSELQRVPKTYLAGVRLGYESTTLDVEGDLMKTSGAEKRISRADIERVLPRFVGSFEQSIPSFSAAKYRGKPLYAYARRGKRVERRKQVRVERISLLSYRCPLASLEIVCGSGTYVRQLAYDIFKALGVSSMLFSLERTRIGTFDRGTCAALADIEAERWKKFVVADASGA